MWKWPGTRNKYWLTFDVDLGEPIGINDAILLSYYMFLQCLLAGFFQWSTMGLLDEDLLDFWRCWGMLKDVCTYFVDLCGVDGGQTIQDLAESARRGYTAPVWLTISCSNWNELLSIWWSSNMLKQWIKWFWDLISMPKAHWHVFEPRWSMVLLWAGVSGSLVLVIEWICRGRPVIYRYARNFDACELFGQYETVQPVRSFE